MGPRVREDGSGDSRRGGGPSAESTICVESPAGRKTRVRGRTCRRGKGFLRGRDCRRYGHSFVRDRDLDDDYCD